MDKLLNILKGFRDIFWVVIVLVLLVTLNFKNKALNNCRSKEPEVKIEYVYIPKIDTIKDTLVQPYKVVEYKDKIIIETDTVPMELTEADSAQIAEAYSKLYKEYNKVNEFDNVLKDDSTAYIQLKEKVTRNSIFDRELIFQDRTPIVYVTKRVPDKTFSIIGGLDASIGTEFNTVSAGLGFVTKSNSVYLFKYDPVNKGFGGAVYFPIFNFKNNK